MKSIPSSWTELTPFYTNIFIKQIISSKVRFGVGIDDYLLELESLIKLHTVQIFYAFRIFNFMMDSCGRDILKDSLRIRGSKLHHVSNDAEIKN